MPERTISTVNEHKPEAEILFITHKYPPSTGGMQKQSFELIQYVKAVRKVHMIIFSNNYPKFLFFLIVTPWALWKMKKNKNIQIIHANDGLMALILTPLLRLQKRIRICATIHGLDIVFNASFYQYWVRQYLTKFDFLLAVSQATKDECVNAGISESKVHFIPNAVELPDKPEKDPNFKSWLNEQYGLNLTNEFIISSVGRPVPRKGFSWFAKNVLPKLGNAKYLVVGTELESSWIILIAKKLLTANLFGRICKLLGVPLDNIILSQLSKEPNANLILLGKIPQDKLIQTYLHSDIFVMPNFKVEGDFEGFGLVALEAASLGAVCLASNVDGIPSAIKDGDNGFLLESKNTEAWVNKIEELKKGDQLALSRAHFSNYFSKSQMSWENMGEEYLKVFDQSLQSL